MNFKLIENNIDSPVITIQSDRECCWEGWEAIIKTVDSFISTKKKKKTIVCIECYPGTYESINLNILKTGLNPSAICLTVDLLKEERDIKEMVSKYVPENDIFGKVSGLEIKDFFQDKKTQSILKNISQIDAGTVLIFGIGASLLFEPDLLIYADMSLYEIQQRFRRKDISNIGLKNQEEAYEKQYARGFFIDWLIGNKIKKSVLKKAHFVLDTNNWQRPKMVKADALREGLAKAAHTPFIQAPFFDPQFWDGPNHKKPFDDFHWYYSCIPEENCILFRFGNILFESPVINAIYLSPKKMLGKTVYHLFGAELPLRMKFIDTLDTGNDEEVIQVDPDTEALKNAFSCEYKGENSYYVMASIDGSGMYLGLKDKAKKKELTKATEKKNLVVDRYFQEIHLHNHDHVMVPTGIPYSNGHRNVILKIGISPDFLSFRLWQHQKTEGAYDEIMLQLHKKRALEAIDFDEEMLSSEYINQIEIIEQGEGWIEEKLGGKLYRLIEQRRHRFSVPVLHYTEGTVQVLNLVKGEKVIVESLKGEFEPFVVYYSQTFIVPAAVESFKVRPLEVGEEYITLKAFIK